MVHYYLDIETFGEGEKPDPVNDKIVTITFCAVDPKTGKQLQEPVVLKEWESSEEEIVKQLCKRMIGKQPFDFVPCGFSVLFDLWFLKHKFKQFCNVDLGERFYMERPYMDLKQVMVFKNHGQFKGVKLGAPGNPMHEWYALEDYESIERYVQDKLEKFLQEWQTCLTQ